MANSKSQIPNSKPKIFFLVGPTAIGKSTIAVHLTRILKTEIISCDSMQIYKGLNIITSKPSLALRKAVPHHLMDSISPLREYNVARYYRQATRKIKKVLKRGKTPLVVGGTGLYMSILIDGIFESKSKDKNIRRRLYKKAERYGNLYLYGELKRIDPQAAFKIHPHDTKRIVRAIEVFENTGRPISSLQRQRRGLAAEYELKIIGLNTERSRLYKKIDRRVDKMFSQGLVSEVKRLLKFRLSKTAHQAIGIKELKGYFDGAYDLDEARRLIKSNTRLYAKRQLTWFRKDKRINWLWVKDKEKPKDIANRIWKKLF